MNNFQNPNWNNQNQRNQQQANFQQTNSQAQTPQEPSMMTKLLNSCLPVLLEQFTGQVMPSAGGNAMETQMILSQVLNLQQQIVTTLKNLDSRLVSLEQNASNQLTNLTQQVQSIKSIRLSHEKKQIDYNLQPEQEN